MENKLTEQRRAVAEDNLGKRGSDYSLYKYETCGHTKFIQRSKVKAKGFIACQDCVRLKITADEKSAGLERLSGSPENPNNYIYKIVECGHIQEISLTCVRNKTFECRTCKCLTYIKEAEDAGLTLLNPSDKNNAERLYKFNTCGHIRLMLLCYVRAKTFHCTECQDLKIQNEAKRAGLEYLRPATQEDMRTECKNHAVYRHILCGHQSCLSKTAVRNKMFKCNTCKIGYSSRKSYIYLYLIKYKGFEWLKLGFSVSPEERLRKYKLPENFEANLLYSTEIENGKLALFYERSIHNKYKQQRLCSKLMKNYMEDSGFTECYPVLLENKLKEELYCLSNIKEFND